MYLCIEVVVYVADNLDFVCIPSVDSAVGEPRGLSRLDFPNGQAVAYGPVERNAFEFFR